MGVSLTSPTFTAMHTPTTQHKAGSNLPGWLPTPLSHPSRETVHFLRKYKHSSLGWAQQCYAAGSLQALPSLGDLHTAHPKPRLQKSTLMRRASGRRMGFRPLPAPGPDKGHAGTQKASWETTESRLLQNRKLCFLE